MNSHSRTGLLFALCGFALLTVGDSVLKTIEGEWTAIGSAALRFVIGATGLSLLLLFTEGPRAFIPANPWLQLGRGVCLALSTATFFSALFVMPLAEATSLIFVSPIFTAILSRPLLGEQIRPAVWIACLVALIGVALILRPNLLELGWQAVLPLIAALSFGLMVIANRASAGTGSALSMQVYMAVVAAFVLVILAWVGGQSGIDGLELSWPAWDVAVRCAFVALTASTAHYLVYLGTTRAGASAIAPMVYVQLLMAVIMGWLLFGDRPDAMTLTGAAVIIASGLYLWRDGRKLSSTQAR